MRIDILTLFPASVDAMMNVSILGRAQERGYITIKTHQIRGADGFCFGLGFGEDFFLALCFELLFVELRPEIRAAEHLSLIHI